ncbi:MAG: imidazolonepropionase [Armatimonadetes bacterium]|nr:imidazolonepropionase [Armatimonadota bacterium]
MLLLEKITTLVTVAAPDERSIAAIPVPHRAGSAMGEIGVVRNAAVAIDGERIAWIGPTESANFPDAERIDCTGKTILPGFVDSHTHIVFAGNRANEFAMRLRGATYQEIAEAGGGILSSMRSVRQATVASLCNESLPRIWNAFRHGTTTIEAKSGYGLDTENELKLLHAIQQASSQVPATLIPTFLGAHAIPPEHKEHREEFVRIIAEQMIPIVVEQGLAEFCDVFSDTGYFTVEESEQIYQAAAKHGMKLKVHADELSSFGGAEMAARVGAVSADHLLMISDAGIEQMREAGVVATLLPGTAFYLGLPFAPARKMIAEGMAVALATDCNPGSNMSENMQMTLALACMGMKMTVEEAITAATLNGAAAVRRSDQIGSIEVGKVADLAIFNVPDYPDIVYHYGVNQVGMVVKGGKPYPV